MAGEVGRRTRIRPEARSASRRGRPTSSQAAEIDRVILAAARSLFLSQGYAVTSMEAVAALAGVSKGTLYARYAGKGDLFKEIVADRLQVWSLLSGGERADAAIGLRDRLLSLAISLLNALRMPEVRAFERLVAAEFGRFPELAREFYDRGYRAVVMRVKSDLAAASAGGSIIDPGTLATVFAASLIGWFQTESSVRDVAEAECHAFAEQIVALCLCGLAPDPDEPS